MNSLLLAFLLSLTGFIFGTITHSIMLMIIFSTINFLLIPIISLKTNENSNGN